MNPVVYPAISPQYTPVGNFELEVVRRTSFSHAPRFMPKFLRTPSVCPCHNRVNSYVGSVAFLAKGNGSISVV